MEENKNHKKEPWRIIVAVIAAVFIVVMWVKKDIASAIEAMPKDQLVPVILTTVAVSLLKVASLPAQFSL